MIDFEGLPVRVERMRPEDIGEVLEIERVSFSAPWSARAYDYELRYNDMAHYSVARLSASNGRSTWSPKDWLGTLLRSNAAAADSSVVGYIGFWLMAGEAHISTIAVKPELRGRAIGEVLLVASIDRAVELGAREVTLEVRISNIPAQELYLKYGFVQVGMRKAYYTDNNEDALIMTTPPLRSAEYQQRYQRLKAALVLRLRESHALPRRRARTQNMRGGSNYGG